MSALSNVRQSSMSYTARQHSPDEYVMTLVSVYEVPGTLMTHSNSVFASRDESSMVAYTMASNKQTSSPPSSVGSQSSVGLGITVMPSSGFRLK